MGRLGKECEFCGLNKVFSGEDTVCRECDRALALTHEAEEKSRALAWASTHHCRKCGVGLTPGRFFDCEACLPEAERETHCPYLDGVTSIEEIFSNDFAKTRAAKYTEPKKCVRCGETKPRDQFYFNKSMKDGRFNHCNKCHNRANARYKQKAQEEATV